MMTAPGAHMPKNPGEGAARAAKLVADQNGEIRRIEAGQALTQRKKLDEAFVVEPLTARNQRVAQVGHGAAEARSADDQELEKNIESGDSFGRRAKRFGRVGLRLTHGFAA